MKLAESQAVIHFSPVERSRWSIARRTTPVRSSDCDQKPMNTLSLLVGASCRSGNFGGHDFTANSLRHPLIELRRGEAGNLSSYWPLNQSRRKDLHRFYASGIILKPDATALIVVGRTINRDAFLALLVTTKETLLISTAQYQNRECILL